MLQTYKENLRSRVEQVKNDAETTEQIAKDINDLNEVMRDLAQIVHEQNDMVDSIEEHIENSSQNILRGHEKLQKSIESKNSKLPFFAMAVGSLAVGGPVGIATCSTIAGLAAGVSAGVASLYGGRIFKRQIEKDTQIPKNK